MIVSWACCNFADFWIVFGIIIAAIDMLFLNEWAVIPLTKKARMAQAEVKVSEQTQTDETKTQANQVITEAANDKKGEDKED
jgi:hypothetical protein